jgi:hypothetical protein
MTRRSTLARRAPAPPRAAALRVSIGELRVPGLSSIEGDRFAATFQGELAARLAGAAPSGGRSRERLTIDGFAPVAGESVEDSGRRLAIAIADALGTTFGRRP